MTTTKKRALRYRLAYFVRAPVPVTHVVDRTGYTLCGKRARPDQIHVTAHILLPAPAAAFRCLRCTR